MSSSAVAESMPDRRSWRMAPPSSPTSALSLRIFRGRGSSTATLGTVDGFRVLVALFPVLSLQRALQRGRRRLAERRGRAFSAPAVHKGFGGGGASKPG